MCRCKLPIFMNPEGFGHSNLTCIVLIHIVKDHVKSGGNICRSKVIVSLNITTYLIELTILDQKIWLSLTKYALLLF